MRSTRFMAWQRCWPCADRRYSGGVATREQYHLWRVFDRHLLLGVIALVCLFGRTVSDATLPLGLPWLGAHFRIDALSAFFLIIINLGGAAASLFALGYGRHEEAPQRVLPFYPAYLAGMNLVVLADDAFTFLVSWEFMSLSSWALVVAHHRERKTSAPVMSIC